VKRDQQGEDKVVQREQADARFAAVRTGGLPMYAQLCALFRQRIESGEWKLNEQIPPLEALMEEFGVARVTLRHALGLLESEGLLERYRGRGTFVVDKPKSNIWYRVPSTWEELISTVPDIEFEWLDNRVVESLPAPSHVIGHQAESYQYLRRRLLRHHVPYGVGTTYIERATYESVGQQGFGKPIPLKTLNDSLPGGLSQVEQTVRVGLADLKTAELLDLEPGAPVMLVARTAVDAKGLLIYESFGVFRGDFVEMRMSLLTPPA
jgi:GntR family transcriptional regulator